MLVRTALPGEGELLRQLEIAAGAQFHEIGMAAVAEDEPPAVDLLEEAIADGRIWVVEFELGEVAGYAHAVHLDGAPHLEQVSVHPSFQRRGVGRALVNVAADWARDQGAATLTLTTFRDVAWNGPLYERLEFVAIADDELSPALRAVRAHEAEIGLDDSGPRIAMRRTL
jgi:GNAT superfamily N-acetyltransferase